MFKKVEIVEEKALNEVAEDERGEEPGLGQRAMLYLGVVGVLNLMFVWIVVWAFDRTGVEPFDHGSTEVWKKIFFNGVLDTLFNVFFLAGVTATSPLFMSAGTMFVVPLGIIVDVILGKGEMSILSLVGVALILMGFWLLNLRTSSTAVTRKAPKIPKDGLVPAENAKTRLLSSI